MYVITVAPIKRGIPVEELSYFSKDEVPPGALVSVPVRGKLAPALVVRTISAKDAKAELKSASFALKKLDRIHAEGFFSRTFVEAARETARFHAASTGAVIHALFPNALLLNKKYAAKSAEVTVPPETQKEHVVLQSEDADRFATYKSHIREIFARERSCFFVLPSVADIEHAYAELEKGIREYTFILHGGLSKKTLEERWKKIAETKHPVLVIATPFFLAIPRTDIASIILEHESSGAYMLQGRPFIDLRYFVEVFARAAGARLIFGDLFLRVETLSRKDRGELESLIKPKYRLASLAKPLVVDMRTSGEQPAAGRIAIASTELVNAISEMREKGEHSFILGVRRGFAPMTVCGDCGTVVACTRCSAPLVLHKRRSSHDISSAKKEKPDAGANPEAFAFICHRCGEEDTAERVCTHCGGWRLSTLGIGVAQAEEALGKRFPDATILRMDRDAIKRHKDAVELVKKFYDTPGSIMIGTEMAIPYLTQPVGLAAVLSVNSLLTIPDFRMGERVFRLLLSLRERASERFILQTRDPDSPLFSLASEGNIGEFLKTELVIREKLNYPPYSTLLKFTAEGTRADGEALMGDVEKIFGAYHPVTFPSFIARVRGKYRMNALLKIPPKEWPNDELLGLIRALPPEIEVRINPESVI